MGQDTSMELHSTPGIPTQSARQHQEYPHNLQGNTRNTHTICKASYPHRHKYVEQISLLNCNSYRHLAETFRLTLLEKDLDTYCEGSRMASLFLQLFLYTVAGISAQRLSVFQPEKVKVLEGSTVTLECTYFSTEETSRGTYNWSYSGLRRGDSHRTEVSNKTDRYSGRVFQTSQSIFFAERKADIIIQDIRHYDAGMYFCEVELFVVGSGHGNGTQLEVIQAKKLSIFQPASVKVTEGDTVTLKCAYINAEETISGYYTWFYSRFTSGSRTQVSNNTDRYRSRFFQTNESTFFAERKADITIQDIQQYDAGMYFCEVELFILGFGRGNGTWLEVIPGAPTTKKEEETKEMVEVQLPIYFVQQMGRTVVVLLVFSVIVLLIVRYYAKKKPKKHSATHMLANDYLE